MCELYWKIQPPYQRSIQDKKKIITNKLDWTYLAVNEVRNYYLTFSFSVSAL